MDPRYKVRDYKQQLFQIWTPSVQKIKGVRVTSCNKDFKHILSEYKRYDLLTDGPRINECLFKDQMR